MKAGKIIAYIAAAILIFFGVVFIWGAFGSTPHPGWIVVGVISVIIGFGLIWFAARKLAGPPVTNVTLNLDLPGNVQMDKLTCKSCGGTLSSNDIKIVNGAPMVNCPYCHTAYQITEEPKW
jgi:Na+/melibiose symporter-like transporter